VTINLTIKFDQEASLLTVIRNIVSTEIQPSYHSVALRSAPDRESGRFGLLPTAVGKLTYSFAGY
jgi:hypothetical protein